MIHSKYLLEERESPEIKKYLTGFYFQSHFRNNSIVNCSTTPPRTPNIYVYGVIEEFQVWLGLGV